MRQHPLRECVVKKFVESWSRARPSTRADAVEKLTALYDKFKEAGLADRHFESELCRGPAAAYSQRVGEMLLADYLWRDEFKLCSNAVGPDFFAEKGAVSMWVELHTPEPAGVPGEYFEFIPGRVFNVPHKELSLRWTSAFSEKKRKFDKYVDGGVVSAADKCVIAINASLLNRRGCPEFTGVSTLPIPVEIMFGIGANQVVIDRVTGDVVAQDFECRPYILKSSGVPVPSASFLAEENKGISAVLGVVLSEQSMLAGEYVSAMIYNPFADFPLELKTLKATEHWVCRRVGQDYVIEIA
ncbi:hypothetical protein [Pseudomonas sp. p99-361]|uniref:hypothetical protein n=1 Tax=Pseudomonas sp. p99-361 TaxID=2479852 RepID=UPI000F76E439|nr:hypothetical protein [Pseudomonas sp. p99-361]